MPRKRKTLGIVDVGSPLARYTVDDDKVIIRRGTVFLKGYDHLFSEHKWSRGDELEEAELLFYHATCLLRQAYGSTYAAHLAMESPMDQRTTKQWETFIDWPVKALETLRQRRLGPNAKYEGETLRAKKQDTEAEKEKKYWAGEFDTRAVSCLHAASVFLMAAEAISGLKQDKKDLEPWLDHLYSNLHRGKKIFKLIYGSKGTRRKPRLINGR